MTGGSDSAARLQETVQALRNAGHTNAAELLGNFAESLTNTIKALDYYRAGMERRRPSWVPSRIVLLRQVRSDFPMAPRAAVAEAGEYECHSNAIGAVSVRTTNGDMLGVRPVEFEVTGWRENVGVKRRPAPMQRDPQDGQGPSA